MSKATPSLLSSASVVRLPLFCHSLVLAWLQLAYRDAALVKELRHPPSKQASFPTEVAEEFCH